MRCYFYDDWSDKLLGYMDAEPICNRDLCASCGDCLACYGADPCPVTANNFHFWMKYVKSFEEAVRIAEKYGVEAHRPDDNDEDDE